MATFKRQTSRGVTNTPTAVGAYTVGALLQVTAIGLTVANTHATESIKVNVSLYDGVNDTYIVKGADIPVGGAQALIGGDQKVVMQPGDSIRVSTTNALHTCDAILSVLEV